MRTGRLVPSIFQLGSHRVELVGQPAQPFRYLRRSLRQFSHRFRSFAQKLDVIYHAACQTCNRINWFTWSGLFNFERAQMITILDISYELFHIINTSITAIYGEA